MLVHDGQGRIRSGTEINFPMTFEDRQIRVHASSETSASGALKISTLENNDELAGSFDLELDHCLDADSGEDLGWPPSPLVLQGSFDRLPRER